MPRNKVLERAKVSIDSGRSPFDLSHEAAITSLCGEIDVPYIQPIVKGTKGSVSRQVLITRTADVVSPAFHRVTEHYDFFLVPIQSLWRYWPNWKLNINDMQDTNLVKWNANTATPDLSLPTNAPRVNFDGLASEIYNVSTGSSAEVRLANDCLRIADWMRYCPAYVADSSNNYGSKIMNVLLAAAYQKCYFEHYRNTAYENNNPYAYNFDWLYQGSADGLFDTNEPKDTNVLRQLFKIRRVNYRNDYFHNIYPSLNYVVSSPQGLNFSLPSDIGGLLIGQASAVNSSLGNVAALGVSNTSVTTGASLRGGTTLGILPNQTFAVGTSVQSIRAAFALDKLMRASAYAPKHVKEQYKAQFGVDGKDYDGDMRSTRIASFESGVVFQEVTNMAQSASYNLGDLGAKGIGSSDKDKPVSFYAEYDSILICMHYFLPRARYDSDGVEPWNTNISRDSFYVKAFENLGLRPIYSFNLDGTKSSSFAWTVPNFTYKIKPDLNHGAFKDKFLSYYFDPDAASGSQISLTESSSVLSTFVPHTLKNFTGSIFSAEYFKVSPEDLDNIFKVSVGGSPEHPIGLYQFFTDYRISVPVVAPMSVHGQPSL